MKKVLIVTYHYPPSPAVGAVRPSKFVSYLPQFGWEPIVLTVAAPDACGNVSRNGSAEIHRVREWPHPLKAYERFKVNRPKREKQGERHIARMAIPYEVAMAASSGGIAGLKRWLLAFLWLPDQEVGWFVRAVWKGWRLIREKQISHVITTAPPFTCHLIGLVLKRLTGIQWVADFRDPWSLRHKPLILRNRVTDYVEARLIRSVMKQADLIVSVTPSMTDQAKKEHPDTDPDKFVTLTNGFDASDFVGLASPRPSPDPVVFSYLGTFYYGRTPEPFLRALRMLIDDGTLKADDIRVKFIGQVMMAEGRSVPEMVRQYNLQGIVSVHPPAPRLEALRQTLETHVALVLDEQHPIQVPLKFYEALASGAIILNIGSRGAVSDLLARTGRGVAVRHTNVYEIREGILESIRRVRAGESMKSVEPWMDQSIQDYNFHLLTRRLAALLDSLGKSSKDVSTVEKIQERLL